MTRLAPILTLLASPAFAEPTISWGGTGAALAMTGKIDHVATVRCINELTSGPYFTSGRVSVGAFSVGVSVHHGPCDVPDVFEIVPPEGFIAVPAVVEVGEGGAVDVLIFVIGGMS